MKKSDKILLFLSIVIFLVLLGSVFFMFLKPNLTGFSVTNSVTGFATQYSKAQFEDLGYRQDGSMSISPVTSVVSSLNDQVTVTLNVNANAILHKGFYSINGQAWRGFNLNGNNLYNRWLEDSATKTLTFSASDFDFDENNVSNDNYIISYACNKNGFYWTCHNKKWQIIQFTVRLSNSSRQSEDYCGDLICQATEDCNTCKQDCGRWTDVCSGTTYYASPIGGGDGLSEKSPFQIADFWPIAQPGDTLLMLDGIYKGDNSMLDPPSDFGGTKGSPITLRALNDGKVEFDGEKQRVPVNLGGGTHFIVAEGFNAHDPGPNPSTSTVSISYANDVVLRRVVAWDAGIAGNNNVIGTHHSKNVLIEDCGAFGTARKVLSNSQDGNNATFRRCWARWEGGITHGPKMTATQFYNSYNLTLENNIYTWDALQIPETYYVQDYYGNDYEPNGQKLLMTNYMVYHPGPILGGDGWNDDRTPVAGTKSYGNIIYVTKDAHFRPAYAYGYPNNDWVRYATASHNPDVEIDNMLVVYENDPEYMDTLRFISYTRGLDKSDNPLPLSLYENNTVHHQSWLGGTGETRSWSDDLGIVIDKEAWDATYYRNHNCSAVIEELGYDNVLDLSDRGGAKVMTRIVDGVDTGESLWPWPMNQRILDATTAHSLKPVDVTAEVFGLCGGTVPEGIFSTTTFDEAVTAAQNWLAADETNRAQYEATLSNFNGDIDAVIEKIRPKGTSDVTGLVIRDFFEIPELAAKYPGHDFNYYVPETYDPSKPMGLMIWMHGGGIHVLDYNQNRYTGFSKTAADGNYIYVAPEGVFGDDFPEGVENAGLRWSQPTTQAYLSDIIKEFSYRYNIDPNRILLSGFSMGGIGAFHQVLQMDDRFAAVQIASGGWSISQWRVTLNTPSFIIGGINDSYWAGPTDYRWHGTDIMKDRIADEILTDLGIKHRYFELEEHHGGEKFDPAYKVFFNGKLGWGTEQVRDPYANRVIAITTRGIHESYSAYGITYYPFPTPIDRWVTIGETTPGQIETDWVHETGQDIPNSAEKGVEVTYDEWANWGAYADTKMIDGSEVDIENVGNNVFVAKTTNVLNFSIWLHPKMIDVTKPVKVIVNGKSKTYTCNPSLLDAVRSYERREDWGLIYHCEIEVVVDGTGMVETDYCGDDTCGSGESCSTCSRDCGVCPEIEPIYVCGDNTCNGNEDCSSCSSDCGICNVDGGNANTCGSQYNPTGQPIGGGIGYIDGPSSTDADFVVDNIYDLQYALHYAQAGDVVWLKDGVYDFTDYQIIVKPGVTLAGGRGKGNSLGPLLVSDHVDRSWTEYILVKAGARLTGLRIEGPNPLIKDIDTKTNYADDSAVGCWDAEIDNVEIYKFSSRGIFIKEGTDSCNIHHNYIHDIAYSSIEIDKNNGDNHLIEANDIEWAGQAIVSSGTPGVGFTARYNTITRVKRPDLLDPVGKDKSNEAIYLLQSNGANNGKPRTRNLELKYNTFLATNDVTVGDGYDLSTDWQNTAGDYPKHDLLVGYGRSDSANPDVATTGNIQYNEFLLNQVTGSTYLYKPYGQAIRVYGIKNTANINDDIQPSRDTMDFTIKNNCYGDNPHLG